MKLKIFYFVFFFLLGFNKLKAQNYNINFNPARITYGEYFYTDKKTVDLFLLNKFLEIEKKLYNSLSLNLGFTYSREKDKIFLGLYKELYYKLEPSVRYYLNKNNKMNGFYLGSGSSYIRNSLINEGRFASEDGSLKENNVYRNFVNLSIQGGYKFSLIKNRFSIDLKVSDDYTILNHRNTLKVKADNSTEITNVKITNSRVEYPYLDLKLGYRFGFKK